MLKKLFKPVLLIFITTVFIILIIKTAFLLKKELHDLFQNPAFSSSFSLLILSILLKNLKIFKGSAEIIINILTLIVGVTAITALIVVNNMTVHNYYNKTLIAPTINMIKNVCNNPNLFSEK